MQGRLHIAHGVLYVGRHAQTARVRAYDLDGRPLATELEFRDKRAGRSEAGGLCLDADHRLWVTDPPAGRLRAFTLFGVEVASVGGEGDDEEDRAGRLGSPIDVLSRGTDDELELVVASRGVRRHALQVLHPASGRSASLRPSGDPRGQFRRLRALAQQDELLFVLESGRQRVQVYRGADHHFDIPLPLRPEAEALATGLALAPDGQLVVSLAGPDGGVWLVDRRGVRTAVLAETGPGDGEVEEPGDVAVEPGANERDTRVLVIDRDGERVQVFNLDGSCYGAFPALGA